MSDFDHTPPSRFEQIMRAIIDGTEVPTGEPRSVMEALLLELNNLVKSIGGGIKVIGVTTTPLTDGGSTNPIMINGESYTAKSGDMVAYSAKEFLFNNGSIWQELGDVYEVMAIIDDILANMAPNFSSSVSYDIGAYVIQNNHFYKCTTAHSGAWADADFTQTSIASELIALKNYISAKQDATDNDLETTDKTIVGAINELKDDISEGLAAIKNGSVIGSFADVEEALESKTDNDDVVASAFSAAETYAAGDYCTYEGGLYKFKTAHEGAWDAADVDRIQIAGELSELKNTITANTFVEAVSLVSDTPYTCPSDGYANVYIPTGAETTLWINSMANFDVKNTSGTGNYHLIYVKKGMIIKANFLSGHVVFRGLTH